VDVGRCGRLDQRVHRADASSVPSSSFDAREEPFTLGALPAKPGREDHDYTPCARILPKLGIQVAVATILHGTQVAGAKWPAGRKWF